MTTTRKFPREQVCFKLRPAKGKQLFAAVPAAQAEGDGEASNLRPFSGVAASGKPFRDEWFGNFALDLEGLEIPEGAMAVLRDHNPGKILGYSSEISKTDNGLEVQGMLVTSTEDGKNVADLADAGFPWQMSVYIPPSIVEHVLEGETAEVNGHTFQGPGFIFRRATLRELTITATGRDQNTSAQFAGIPSEVEAEILDRNDPMGNQQQPNSQTPAQGTQQQAAPAPAAAAERAQFSQILAMAKEAGAPYDLVGQAVDSNFSVDQAKALFAAFAAGKAAGAQAAPAPAQGAAPATGTAAPEGQVNRAAHHSALRQSTGEPSGSAEETVVETPTGNTPNATEADDLKVVTLEQFSARADLVQEFGRGADGFATFSAWRDNAARALA